MEEWGGALLKWPDDKADDRGLTVWHVAAQDSEWFSPSTSSFMLEIVVGLALMGAGFGALWLFVGERALDYSGTTAWGIGGASIGGGAVAFLATREILQKRRAAAEERRMRRR